VNAGEGLDFGVFDSATRRGRNDLRDRRIEQEPQILRLGKLIVLTIT